MSKLTYTFKEFESMNEWDKDSFIVTVGFFCNDKKEVTTIMPIFMQYNKQHESWGVLAYKWKDMPDLDGILMWAPFPKMDDIKEFIKEKNYITTLDMNEKNNQS